ncbi:MarR family winged helix-turn-helix transcriptional regulator [Isoptericola variabilis]|uniref:Transcriptional regulator, MarR family n=1 Tax=Isoptericola variabilis (strain 225) TaxID=743718 RepID=F6FWL8_ISOV2|nr:MarR family winged helix-turn-helix transcriptional regulator [Isoptericola variabilis]AEG45659.1 transcriptional regulator, MarR family [Isoptericola variabilis 225]TWH28821.1 DNA-binding MarR family transcriptional regulator [Isoptericola variabilis J7]
MTADAGAPPAAPPQVTSSTVLGWALAALLREWSTRVEAVTADLPHGPRGYRVLAAVVHDSPPTQAALASMLGIDRTVMTYLLDRFVECDLVERRQDPADRRARRVVATEHGRRVLADLDARVAAAEEQLLEGLEPADRDALRTLLARAATAAAPGDDPCGIVARFLDAEGG